MSKVPQPISFKQVLDTDGALVALELWQEDRYITVTMSIAGSHRAGYRWSEIRDVVDGVQQRVRNEAAAYIADMMK